MSRVLLMSVLLSLGSAATIASEAPLAAPLGTISGPVQFPGCHLPDDLEICAEPATGGQQVPCVVPELGAAGPTYQMTLPAGSYRIFARAPSVDLEYRAYYTAAVKCGLSVGCDDHRALVVRLPPQGHVQQISPADWVTPEFEPLPSTLALVHSGI